MAAQIRNTIELLTSILCENGTTKIRAETFRQAKFDQEEAVSLYPHVQLHLHFFFLFCCCCCVNVLLYWAIQYEYLEMFMS